MGLFLDYGDGRSGSAQGISGTVNTYATCTGSAGTRTVTTALSVAIGDLVTLIQTQGTGAGVCETVRAATATSAGSFTTTKALDNSYVSGAQAIKVPQYSGGTTGALTVPNWNGSTGGIGVIFSNGPLTIGSTSAANGGNGATGSGNGARPAGGVGAGFGGGAGHSANPSQANQGDSSTGNGAASNAANGSGGGGAMTSGPSVGRDGGGAGYVTVGDPGNATGGATQGISSLVNSFYLGAGGGGAANDGGVGESIGGGGSGAGGWIIFAPSVSFSAGVTANGGNGGAAGADGGAGAGGAGGSILVGGVTVVLGSNIITAAAGTSSTGTANASVGRIAVWAPVSSGVSGTTSPSYTFVADNSFAQQGQGFIS